MYQLYQGSFKTMLHCNSHFISFVMTGELLPSFTENIESISFFLNYHSQSNFITFLSQRNGYDIKSIK